MGLILLSSEHFITIAAEDFQRLQPLPLWHFLVNNTVLIVSVVIDNANWHLYKILEAKTLKLDKII